MLRATPDLRVGGASSRGGRTSPGEVGGSNYCGVGPFRLTYGRACIKKLLGGLTHPEHSPLSPGESRYPSSPVELPEAKMPQLGALDEMSGKGSGALTVEPGKTFRGAQTGCKIRFPPVEEVRREESTLL